MPEIQRDGTSIAYEVSGDGPGVILGSSFLMNREMWRPQIDRLADRYRVIAVDWRGHGASGPATGTVTLDDLADDFVAVLEAEGVDRAVWGGLSLGGMVAMRQAIRAPESVRGLILIDTDAGTWTLRERLKFKAMGLGAKVAGIRRMTPLVLRTLLADRTRREEPDLVAFWRDALQQLSVTSILCILDTLARRPSQAAALASVEAPTAVIHGLDDTAIPVARGAAIQAAIRGASLKVLRDCGHIATLDQPQLVGDEMERFLGSVFEDREAGGPG
ncbi:MAG: alpha/beta fold hydrolase [Dehalococcoidia bacterium]